LNQANVGGDRYSGWKSRKVRKGVDKRNKKIVSITLTGHIYKNTLLEGHSDIAQSKITSNPKADSSRSAEI